MASHIGLPGHCDKCARGCWDDPSCPTHPPQRRGRTRDVGELFNYLGREGRERATNAGGSARRLLTERTVGRVGVGPPARAAFNQGLAPVMEEEC